MSKILLVSDQPVLLRGFEHILANRGFEITGACSPVSFESVLGTGAAAPDLIVLDITAGLTFGDLTTIHKHLPHCPVVLWTDTMPLDLIFRTLEFGVRGIVLRTAQPDQIADSVRKVAGGEMQIGFATQREIVPSRRKVALTPREREIVSLLRQGMRNKQIAGEMNITEGTVKIYLFRLFHKLGVRNRFELARCASIDQMSFTAQHTHAAPHAEALRRDEDYLGPVV